MASLNDSYNNNKLFLLESYRSSMRVPTLNCIIIVHSGVTEIRIYKIGIITIRIWNIDTLININFVFEVFHKRLRNLYRNFYHDFHTKFEFHASNYYNIFFTIFVLIWKDKLLKILDKFSHFPDPLDGWIERNTFTSERTPIAVNSKVRPMLHKQIFV